MRFEAYIHRPSPASNYAPASNYYGDPVGHPELIAASLGGQGSGSAVWSPAPVSSTPLRVGHPADTVHANPSACWKTFPEVSLDTGASGMYSDGEVHILTPAASVSESAASVSENNQNFNKNKGVTIANFEIPKIGKIEAIEKNDAKQNGVEEGKTVEKSATAPAKWHENLVQIGKTKNNSDELGKIPNKSKKRNKIV